jgi:hypothetical protein
MWRWIGIIGWVILGVLGLLVATMSPDALMWDPIAEVQAGHRALAEDAQGMALWHYLRAQSSAPRDSAVQLGVAVVRKLRADILPEETHVTAVFTRLTSDVMSLAELRWLGLVIWTAAFATKALSVLWPSRGKRRAAQVLCVMAGAVLAAAVIRGWVEVYQPVGVVTVFEAEGRSAPREDAPVLFVLFDAAEGRILDTRVGWVRLGLADGREAWVSQAAVRRLWDE